MSINVMHARSGLRVVLKMEYLPSRLGDHYRYPDWEISMHGSRRISLKWFLLAVLVFGTSVSICLSSLLNRPIRLNQNVIGHITSAQNRPDNSLTYEELVRAVKRRSTDGSVLDTVRQIQSAEISLIESSIEPARDILNLGLAEVHRDFYLCNAKCLFKNGTSQTLRIQLEKNHFHIVEADF